jgi:hypothetical protein
MEHIIKLQDGIEVEVELSESQVREISYNSEVNSSIDKIQDLLLKVVKPLSNTYQELNKEMEIKEAKITLGVKVGVEGNFILAKSSAGANIQVELTMSKKNA